MTTHSKASVFPSAGVAGMGVIRIEADVADEETVTVGGDVYEFDRAADGVTAGRIAVTAQSDDTPAEATDALLAEINASGTSGVLAVDIDANEIALFTADTPGGNIEGSTEAIALAETMAGTNNEVHAATFTGGSLASAPVAFSTRVPDATEVATGNMHFGFSFTPATVLIQVVTTATGITVAWVGGYTISGGRLTLNNAGAVDWATTDTVHVMVGG